MEISADNIKLMITEIGIMKTCQHPNIVQFFDSHIVNERSLWVVMEYMDGGCLTDILELFDRIQFTEAQVAYVAREVPFVL
jgi:protein-serine/threonine kinase